MTTVNICDVASITDSMAANIGKCTRVLTSVNPEHLTMMFEFIPISC